MSKSLLLQLLDDAAFPAIMLAAAVSQIKVGPYQKEALRDGRQFAASLQIGHRVQQNAGKARRH